MNYYYDLFLDPCALPHDTTFECVNLGFQSAICWVFVLVVFSTTCVGMYESYQKVARLIERRGTARKRRSQVLG
jgi:hypothetical protein